MNHNYRLAFILVVIVLIASFSVGLNEIDPFYKTDITKPAIVQNVVYATGKSGFRIELVVKENNGAEYILGAVNDKYKKGDKILLRLYIRKITGFEKYELN